jgi:hypothetical protein
MVAENPTWGAPRIHGELRHARVRCVRENHLALDTPCPQRP